MRDFVKVVILSPLAAAIIVASFHRLVHEWELAGQMTTILTFVLMFGIWFPFFLGPYIKKKSAEPLDPQAGS